jgi:hypothetical protein
MSRFWRFLLFFLLALLAVLGQMVIWGWRAGL